MFAGFLKESRCTAACCLKNFKAQAHRQVPKQEGHAISLGRSWLCFYLTAVPHVASATGAGVPPLYPRRDRPGETSGRSASEERGPLSPRSETARSFMASVSGYVSSTEGAGGAKMRRPGWWRGPAVTSWTQYRIERDKLPPGCSPLLVIHPRTEVAFYCRLLWCHHASILGQLHLDG